ncbi:MAG: hypothetical protein IKV21_02175 [Clostridia bacterium]|nr:hypothetical protein [Clostridia bacterium]
MKKLLAVALSLMCIFSCFTLSADAALSSSDGVLGEMATSFFEKLLGTEIEEDTSIGYGVIYNMETLSGVSVIYTPTPTVSFSNPGTYTVTSDTPLSIDYEFVCWKDSKGNKYYPGDKIYVDGTFNLYAVWVEKKDGNIRIARVIKTTFEAFKRLVGKFFGVIDTVVNFVPGEPAPKGLYDLTLNRIVYEDTDLSSSEGNERIILHIDSKGFAETKLSRIDKITAADLPTEELDFNALMGTAEIYFCTGWDEVIGVPLNKETYYGSYSFSTLLGPDNEDIMVITTTDGEGNSFISDYLSKTELTKDQEYYMIVTIDQSLYSSFKPANGLDYHERCNPVSVAFTFTK